MLMIDGSLGVITSFRSLGLTTVSTSNYTVCLPVIGVLVDLPIVQEPPNCNSRVPVVAVFDISRTCMPG